MIQFNIEKLLLVMETFNLSQVDVSLKLGISQTYVSLMMKGQKPFSNNIQLNLNNMYKELTDVDMFVSKVNELDSKLK